MDLPRDEYARRKFRLSGKRTGRMFELGQRMQVKVVSVNPFLRRIVLIPV
jgi:exoribonuclease R